MGGLGAALWAEALKARRSNVLWLSALAIALGPLVGALFMLILGDPDWARRAGLLSTKAQIVSGSANWPSYVDILQQALAVGGVVIFSMIAIWMFGREYAQSTSTDLLAVPVGREAIVLAKFIVVAAWALLLVVLLALLGLALGTVLGLPDGSAELVRSTAWTIALVGGMSVLLVTPFAWVASATRGYLAAVGALFLLIFLSQVIAALGWGEVFPWTVPALLARIAGPNATLPGAASYVLVLVAGASGVVATLAWWRFADQ